MPTSGPQELTNALHESARFLKGKLEGVSDDLARVRPRPDRWSILETLEHIVIVDGRLRERLRAAVPGSEKIENPAREALILQNVASRESRFPAPEIVCPKGRFKSVAEALPEVDHGISEDASLAEQRFEDLRYLPIQHPVMGVLNGFEGVLLLAAHIRRHANQIQEIKEQLATSPDL